MVNFTKDEKKLLGDIKASVSQFFPYDYDYSIPDNLLRVIRYWKAKGYCQSYRADQGVQYALYISISGKLGAPLPTRKQVLKKQADKNMNDMMTRINASFDRKLASIQSELEITKAEKDKALNRTKNQAQAQIKKIDAEKAALLERLQIAETSVARLEAARKAEAEKKIEAETEPDPDGNKVRKCWTCGEVFKIAGGIYTKHVKECVGKQEESDDRNVHD